MRHIPRFEARPARNLDRSFVATRLPPLIAIGFGVVFVLVNAGSLPDSWATPVRIAGVVLGGLVGIWVLAGRVHPAPHPDRHAFAVYWRWVAIEAAAILVGARCLMWIDAKQFGVIWVIAVVGAHFIPFARAFGRPAYRVLGVVLILLALCGAAATAVWGTTGAGLAGVAAGAVLFVFAATFGRISPRA